MQEDRISDSNVEENDSDFEKALGYVVREDAKASLVLKIFERPSIKDSFEKKREILEVFERLHPEQRNGINLLRDRAYESYSNEAYSEVMRLTPIRVAPAKKSGETHGFFASLTKLAAKISQKYNLLND